MVLNVTSHVLNLFSFANEAPKINYILTPYKWRNDQTFRWGINLNFATLSTPTICTSTATHHGPRRTTSIWKTTIRGHVFASVTASFSVSFSPPVGFTTFHTQQQQQHGERGKGSPQKPEKGARTENATNKPQIDTNTYKHTENVTKHKRRKRRAGREPTPMSASHRIMPFMTVGSITTVLFLLLGLLVIEAATDTPAESPVSSKRTDGVDPILWTALVVANETGHSTRDLLEQSQQCSVCTNQKPVPLPDKRLVVEGIPVETCAELDATAAYLPLDGDFCDTVRSIGSLCGCVNSKKNNHHHEENDDTGSEPCSLCSDGMSAPNATLSLPDFPANEYLFGAPPGAFMTCETMEAMLLYREDSSSPQCLAIRGDLAERCGCNTEDDDDNNGLPTPVSPTVSPAPSRPPVQQCQLCTYGGGIGLPDKAIELGDLPIENCADVEAFAGLLAEGTDDCEGIKAFGSYCGCSFPEESCTFCPNGEPVPFPDKKLQWFGDYLESLPDSLKSIGDSFTCSMMDSALKVPGDLYGVESSYACLSAQLKSAVCGCSRGWRTNLLNWISRGSGISSMLVSTKTIETTRWSVFVSHRNTRQH